jgi:hypothetical protein
MRVPTFDEGRTVMALFIVKHEHSAETCPAGDPQIAPMLAQRVSKAGARPFGVEIHGEASLTAATLSTSSWTPLTSRR